jgi:hypothetical protein
MSNSVAGGSGSGGRNFIFAGAGDETRRSRGVLKTPRGRAEAKVDGLFFGASGLVNFFGKLLGVPGLPEAAEFEVPMSSPEVF